MRIGDRIRFLSQTGGGIVVGFDKKGWALVEDTDGFEIPVPVKECVVVEENVVGKEKGVQTLKTVQTHGGDELNLALIYTNEKLGSQFICTLANESNYNMLVTYTVILKGEHTTVFAGEILPYERKQLFTFSKATLNETSKKAMLRAIPFKRGDVGTMYGVGNNFRGIDEKKVWKPKNIIEKEFAIDPVNLLKENMFKENEYLSGKGYVVNIFKEGHNIPDNFDEVKKELLDKFNNDIKEIKVPVKPQKAVDDDNSIVKMTSTGILEVDLHANELLDTTAGMGNTEILLYQLSKFNEVMIANLHKKGSRI
ncbi:MAG: DUF2027 domain-containing protein, partial [Bacteroidales bacterium]